MRPLHAIPLVLTLVLALPGVATAAPAQRFSDDVTSITCDVLATPDGGAAFLIAELSQEFGSFGVLAIWAPGTEPFSDEPVAVSGDSSVQLSGDGSVMTASIDLWAFDPTADPPFGDLLGTATLMAELTPLGEPEPFEEEFKEGNRWFKTSGVRQALLVSGSLTLPDESVVELTNCSGQHLVYDSFSTSPAREPASFIFRDEGIQLSCNWETDDWSVNLFASASEGFGDFSDLVLFNEEGFLFASSEAVLTSNSYSASFEFLGGEGEVVGSASASATLTPTGEMVHLTDTFGSERLKFIGEVLAVDGTLEIELDTSLSLTMDAESCQALEGRSTSHFVDPRGPKPRPLANDTPEGALPLGIGESDSVLTGANALEPEAPCVAGVDPETGEIIEYPITYTAWWTFTGTGGDVTVSTSGSNFDTILAVYELVGEDLVQVACVDDIFEPEFSLQAVATFATQDGATYYIQAGGYGGSTGELIVSLE